MRPCSNLATFAALVALALLAACGSENPFPYYYGDAASIGDTSELDGSGDDAGVDIGDTDQDADAGSDSGPDAEPDAGPSIHPCGGAPTRWQGELADPGAPCGCGGTLTCAGIGALTCVNERERDACGGCGDPDVSPGDACGRCSNGTYSCVDGALRCEGATMGNLCGGCGDLSGAPRGLCGDDGAPRTWVCDGRAELRCEEAGVHNACGGTTPLTYEGESALPGDACDTTCGPGRLVCDVDTGELVCQGPAENACGGCEPISGEVGERCGCNGVLTCDADGGAVCVGSETNVCGGCLPLDVEPGASCEGGVMVCSGPNILVCADPAENACGGTATLDARPGVSCGACGSGTYICSGVDSVVCAGDLGADAFNACGACPVLSTVPDAPCGLCGEGTGACEDDTALCELGPPETRRDACGGCGDPLADGTTCGVCATVRCAGGEQECVFDTSDPSCETLPIGCDELDCASELRTCSENGVGQDASCGDCLPNAFLDDGECVPRECDAATPCETFIGEWSTCEFETTCATQGTRTRTRIASSCVSGRCEAGAEQTDTTSCSRVTTGDPCGGDGVCMSGSCMLPPSALTGLEASTENPSSIRLTWDRVDGATGYEISIGGGAWFRTTGTSYTHSGAPAPSLHPCATRIAASDGTRLEDVALACEGSRAEPGADVAYRVRAYNSVGTGASASATGRRPAPEFALRWEYSAVETGGFAALPGATSATWNDTTADPDGEVRWYRVRATGAGALSTYAGPVSGFRAPPVDVPGNLRTTSAADRVTVEWDPVDGATYYELEIDGVWQRVNSTSYADTDAEAASILPCTLVTASRGHYTDRVALRCGGAEAVDGAERTYRVRAVTALGTGSPSAERTGARTIGALNYQWERSDDESGPFSTLTGVTGATADDTSAPTDFSVVWYRVRISASGATAVRSAVTWGRTGDAPALELGQSCLSDDVCASGYCGNGHCAPPGMAFIPAGGFLRGSPTTETGRTSSGLPCNANTCSEEDQRPHGITRPFFLGETEVTNAEWVEMFPGESPSFFDCGDDCPVESVTWYEALEYTNRRSAAEGLRACYALSGCTGTPGEGCPSGTNCAGFRCATANLVDACDGYRLATESEWEYAYRAGTETALYTGDLTTLGAPAWSQVNPIAWNAGNAGESTHPVGGLTPNDWGLHDMAGNVWEWVYDAYSLLPFQRFADWAFDLDTDRVHRGGFWASPPEDLRAATRGSTPPDQRNADRGLRVARSVPDLSCELLACDEIGRSCDERTATCAGCLAGYVEADGGVCFDAPLRPVVSATTTRNDEIVLTWDEDPRAQYFEVTYADHETVRVSEPYFRDANPPDDTVEVGPITRGEDWTTIDLSVEATRTPVDVRYSVVGVSWGLRSPVGTAVGSAVITAPTTYEWIRGTSVPPTVIGTSPSLVDTSASPTGTQYRYSVIATVGDSSDAVWGNYGRYPTPVASASHTWNADNEAVISWPDHESATGWRVESTPSGQLSLAGPTATIAPEVSLAPCTFGVTAVGAHARLECLDATATTDAFDVSIVATNISGQAAPYVTDVEAKSITLDDFTWYRATSASGPWTSLATTTEGVYEDTDVPLDTPVWYRVTITVDADDFTNVTTSDSVTIESP